MSTLTDRHLLKREQSKLKSYIQIDFLSGYSLLAVATIINRVNVINYSNLLFWGFDGVGIRNQPVINWKSAFVAFQQQG